MRSFPTAKIVLLGALLSFVASQYFLAAKTIAAPDNKKSAAERASGASSAKHSHFHTAQLEAYVNSGHYKEARALLASYMPGKDNEDERRLWLATCLNGEQRFEDAVAVFDQSKGLSDACEAIQGAACSAYLQIGDYDKAIKWGCAATEKGGDYNSFVNLAGAYLSTQQYDKAAGCFVAAGKKYPARAPENFCQAANAMLVAGRPKDALAFLDRSPPATHGPATVTPTLLRATSLERLNRWPEALAVLNKGMTLAKEVKGVDSEMAGALLRGVLGERAKVYDKLGKTINAAADRAELKRLSESVESDLVGH